MPLAPGTILGHYEIRELLGTSGMGEVYRAFDPRVEREVAIKVSHAEFSERFTREAKVIAQLNHPNICTLFDVGPNYLVMELIEGPTLADRMQEGPVPFEETLKLLHQMAAALGEAHEKASSIATSNPPTSRSVPADWLRCWTSAWPRSAQRPPRKATTHRPSPWA